VRHDGLIALLLLLLVLLLVLGEAVLVVEWIVKNRSDRFDSSSTRGSHIRSERRTFLSIRILDNAWGSEPANGLISSQVIRPQSLFSRLSRPIR
jgi:hypothetical protein